MTDKTQTAIVSDEVRAALIEARGELLRQQRGGDPNREEHCASAVAGIDAALSNQALLTEPDEDIAQVRQQQAVSELETALRDYLFAEQIDDEAVRQAELAIARQTAEDLLAQLGSRAP